MNHNGSLRSGFWTGKYLPVLLQTEAAECGIACLAMIVTYWGQRIDLTTMRSRFSVSLKGATLKSLISIAQRLGLQTRPLKLDLDRLQTLRMPSILHWDMNHFVVLKSVNRKRIVIHDPLVGERSLSFSAVSKHFTGIALELTPGSDFRRGSMAPSFSLRSLMGRVVGLRRGLIQLLLLGVALQICLLAMPFYMQWIVDEALVTADKDLITVLGLGFLMLVFVQTMIGAVRSWVTTVLATQLNFQWLGNAFAHLMRLPLAYFEKRHLGDIASRFGSIQTIQHALSTQFVEAVIDGLLVTTTFAVLLRYSVNLTLVPVLAVVLYVLLRLGLFRLIRNATAEQIIHTAKQQTHFLESVRGVQSVRLFNRAEERRIGWMNALADQFNADIRLAKLSTTYHAAQTLLFGTERIAVIWLAALAVLKTEFSIGMLFAFISYKDQFSQRMVALIDSVFDFRMLRLHGERVADILLSSPEVEHEVGEIDREQIMPLIELRKVSFHYAEGEPYVLKNVNLTIPSGECIAITGASGCGKTTLIKLLLGLLVPTEGEILVSGFRLDRLGLTNYRQVVGTVMQDDQLFAGSIADNICFFDPEPNHDKIIACARLAAIHDEISAMPMAFNTLVGDIGTGLSGGQKQRLFLARALYKEPKMLVLDEATSHLDVANEKLVNAAIRQIDMTRIIVAHRPETIAMADRVIVMKGGEIEADYIHDRSDETVSYLRTIP